MPTFRVYASDTVTRRSYKDFDAPTADDARHAAEEDTTWSPRDGWTAMDDDYTDSGVDKVEEL